MRKLLACLLACLMAALIPAGASLEAKPAPAKRIAFTFDDVPRRPGAWLGSDQRTAMLIAALRRSGVRQAAFFLNPGNLAKDYGSGGEARIAAYVAAGHVIANHSFSHPMLTAVPADSYLADIDAAQRWLAGRAGFRPWFRYPFLNEGRRDKAKRDAVRAGLKARGLSNGYVTVDAYDWHIDQLASDAVAAGKAVDRAALKAIYIAAHLDALDYYDAKARALLGRSPAHVMLMHETDSAALFLPDLIQAMKARGWTIITADEAYADPLARMVPDPPSAQGTIIDTLAWARGLGKPRYFDRDDEAVLKAAFDARALRPAPVETRQ